MKRFDRMASSSKIILKIKESFSEEDEEIKADLEGNKGKNLEKVYESMISRKLSQRFIDFFIEHNPEKLTEYLQTGINKFINLEAFKLATAKLGIA